MARMKDYELSYKDELLALYSDMYKDLNGCRPGSCGRIDDMSVEELQAELSDMSDAIGEEIDREAAYTAKYTANLAAAEADPRGFVWEGDYDYYANTTKQGYIVPAAPANDTMAAAFARAGA